MKSFIYLIIPMLLSPILFCAGEDADVAPASSAIICNPPELILKNISGYIANEVYRHEAFDYHGGEVIVTDMADNTEIQVDVSHDERKYFTFLRQVTSTSSETIAVTTSVPIVFSECFKYTLNMLELDFFIEDFDNFTYGRKE